MTFVEVFDYPSPVIISGSATNAMDFPPGSGTLFGSVNATINLEEEAAGLKKSRPNGAPETAAASYLVTINTSTAQVTLVSDAPTETGLAGIAFSPALVGPPAKIMATSGTPQSTVVNTFFQSQLVATVTDTNNNPVPGVTVTFTVPATGPSAMFTGGVNTAVTNASGVATSVTRLGESVCGRTVQRDRGSIRSYDARHVCTDEHGWSANSDHSHGRHAASRHCNDCFCVAVAGHGERQLRKFGSRCDGNIRSTCQQRPERCIHRRGQYGSDQQQWRGHVGDVYGEWEFGRAVHRNGDITGRGGFDSGDIEAAGRTDEPDDVFAEKRGLQRHRDDQLANCGARRDC